jgi:hypothetical protein
MSDNQFCSVDNKDFHTRSSKKTTLGVMKWSALSLGVASIFMSFSLVVRAAGSWAQCGADSYVDCSGGVRCTETDQVGCACYDSGGHVVDKHSCKEAAPDEGCYVEEEYAY